MNKLDAFLRSLSVELSYTIPAAVILEFSGNTIRRLVAEDKADEWKRDSDAAMERRARLNGRTPVDESGFIYQTGGHP